ncbi:hypothetical protein [Planomicrobium sp. CPCC 101079]|uniref:hypothetical protein n=1 Tax=Planomicrobium sp. CPCC 101079 TaxID=2599618 RepID=UPI0011B5DBF2|nr:hypothetical protein [Planomicrobium sp. CPCC 101079]TWT04905.1 hypothetical protein FQV28_09910 [Planomicrobium sp. CPCC 101079]
MRYLQYKGLLERENKKSLKKIMYETCVTEGLNASLGAKKLGIAKEVFVYWRKHYRLEQRQILFDQTVEDIKKYKSLYADEAKSIDLDRPLLHQDEKSLQGLSEAIERTVEYYKYLHYKSEGLALETAKLPLYKFSRNVVDSYYDGKILDGLNQPSNT